MENQPSMSKIYSRKRIANFKPKKYNWNKNNKKKIKILFILYFLGIIVFIYFLITKSIEPIFNKICLDEASSIATKIVNDESSKVMENCNYSDLYKIEKDEIRKYTNDKCKHF